MAIGNTVAQAGLGMVLGEWNDARQRRQQKKLQGMQIEGQKELGEFNRQQAMKMWEDTNYDAQRKQLEKAGLNVGLMYGTAGGGGTTQGGAAGSVTGASAPVGGGEVGMAMQLGLQKEMQKASIENIKADTEVKKKEAGEKLGTPAQATANVEATQTGIEATKLQIKNQEVVNRITQYEEQIKLIEMNIADKNQTEAISQMKLATQKLRGETQQAVTEGKIAEATAKEVIKSAELNNLQTVAQIAATKTGIQLTKEQINKVGQDIMNMQVGLSQTERRIRLEQIANEYNTGSGAQGKRNTETIKMWVNMMSDMIGAITGND